MLRTLPRESTAVFSVRLLAALLQLVQVAVAVWLLPIELAGMNGMFWSGVLIARVGGPLGLDLLALKEQPTLWVDNATHARALCCRDTKNLFLVMVGLTLMATLLADPFMEDPNENQLVLSLLIAAPAAAFQRLWSAHARARGDIVRSQLIETLVPPTLGIIAVSTIGRAEPTMVLIAQASAVVLGLLITYLIWPARLHWTRKYPPLPWRQVAHLGSGVILTAFATRLPIFFVGVTQPSQAAIYDIAQRTQAAGVLGANAASTVYAPKISIAAAKGDQDSVRRMIIAGVVSAALPASCVLVVVMAVALLASPDVLDSEYKNLAAPALALAVAAVITAATGLLTTALAVSGRERLFAGIAASTLLVVVLGAVAVGHQSALAMAIVVLLAELIKAVALIVTSQIRGER